MSLGEEHMTVPLVAAAPAPVASPPDTSVVAAAPAADAPTEAPTSSTPKRTKWEWAQALADDPDLKLPPDAFGEVKEGEPYPDLIKFPGDDKPKPEVWDSKEVNERSSWSAKYEWEKETDRGYIYEERLETAEEHRFRGNEHFHAAQEGDDTEWELALRRYRRAIFFAHFDEMQMHDFTDHHREHAEDIQRNSKLNFVACVAAMHELDSEDLPEGAMDQAVELVADLSNNRRLEDDPKVHFRRGQLAMLRNDLSEAREAMDKASRLGGAGKDHRVAMVKLRRLEKEARERERALYGAKIQKKPLYPEVEAAKAKADYRAELKQQALTFLSLPITLPYQGLMMLLSMLWALATRVFLKLAKADQNRPVAQREGGEKED